jgi:hypothetical protein
MLGFVCCISLFCRPRIMRPDNAEPFALLP